MDKKQSTAALQKRTPFQALVTISHAKAWVERAVEIMDQDMKTHPCLDRFVPLRDELVRRMTNQTLELSQCQELLGDTSAMVITVMNLIPTGKDVQEKSRDEVLAQMASLHEVFVIEEKFAKTSIAK